MLFLQNMTLSITFLSFGQDIIWRKKLWKHLPKKNNMDILDIATGTGDLIFSIPKKQLKKIDAITGIDFAEKMIEISKKKAKTKKFPKPILFTTGDATQIPFPDQSMDVCSISFGIRNVENLQKSLMEMLRILKPNGKALFLEFSLPKNRLIKKGYLFYLRKILPTLAGFISGEKKAYQYLNKTVETFPYGEDFCKILKEAGFEKVTYFPITFGIATIYSGEKNA